jgi:uncharacterized protein (DUF2267 family)
MSETGYSAFDTTVAKTNGILHQIEEAYQWPKERRGQSYAALRSVLHTLRDRLTIAETAHLAAQLPMLVRGIFYHAWDPSRVPVKMHRDEFLERLLVEFPYEVEGGPERLVHTVLHALQRFVSEGEWQDIKASLPKDLVPLVP